MTRYILALLAFLIPLVAQAAAPREGPIEFQMLPSCTAAGSTLNYNAATGKFVCTALNGQSMSWSAAQTFTQIAGYLATITTQAGQSYTLANSDCGTMILFTNAVTVTLPKTAPTGCEIALQQYGTGTVSVAAQSGATLNSPHNYSITFAEHSVIGVAVDANAGGSAAVWSLIGDGAVASSGTPVAFGCFCGTADSNLGNGPNDSDTQWDSLTAIMGRPPTLVTTYSTYCGNTEANWPCAASGEASQLLNDTRFAPSQIIPMIGWNFGTSACCTVSNFFTNIANGTDDTLIEESLANWKSAGYHTLILRPAWEMNGNWYGWQLNSGNITAFIAAWEHFYTLVHTYASANGMTITVSFSPAAQGLSNGATPIATWVPPAAYIDDYSIDDYGGGPGGSNAAYVDGTGDAWVMSTMVALAKTNGKSISGSEIGGLSTNFAQNYAAYLSTVGVPIAYWNFWDSVQALDLPQGVGSFSLTTDTDCATGGTTGAGGSSPCGAATSPPVTNSVSYWWVHGLGAGGTIKNP